MIEQHSVVLGAWALYVKKDRSLSTLNITRLCAHGSAFAVTIQPQILTTNSVCTTLLMQQHRYRGAEVKAASQLDNAALQRALISRCVCL